MDLSSRQWEGVEQFDAAYLDLARALIAEGRIGSVRDLMLVANRHPDLWVSDAGQTLLADLIVLLLEGLAEGHVADVVPALAICPPDLALTGIDLLRGAFFAEGAAVEMRRLDDAGLLCFALLTGAAGQHVQAIAWIDEALANRYSEDFVLAAETVGNHLRLKL